MRGIAFALTLALLSPPAEARNNILLVFDEDNDLPGLAAVNRSLRQVFRAELKDEVEFYSESLNLSQFADPRHHGVLRANLGRKYEGKRLDLIVAVMGPSLDFLLRGKDRLFPGVPIVFCGADPSDINRSILRPDVTGVLVERDFAPTLEAALRLQPDTREVFVVVGTSGFDRKIEAIARRDLEPAASRVRITWLNALSMDALLRKASDLPAHSIIYYLTLFADGDGRTFVPHDALARITGAANAPVYVSVDQYVGLGAVGGNVYSVGTHGEQAARIALRILRGERPSAIPVVALAAQTNLFDWRELRRWGLDERRLPAGSVVEFRSPSLWDAYKWYIAAGVTLFLLQSLLVVGLLVSRAQRRRAEASRQESERHRRRAEEEALRQRDELAHALRVTTLGELTASFAHELRQPLTAIAANAQAARMLLAPGQVDPEVEEALDDMAVAARRAAATVDRLRALFRKQPAARAAVDVNVLIEDVLGLLASSIDSKHIVVHFTRGERLPTLLGDDIQLRQVIINLLVNAEDAIAQGGGGRREIHIETRRADGGHVAIAIADTGSGAPEAELERIFEHFVSSKPQGLGMGLAISRSIVEAHAGRIWAKRNEAGGLTLYIDLPAPPPAAGTADPARTPAASTS